MHGLFITGTCTGVGKTYFSVLLAKALTKRGIVVVPRKPVESGCDVVDGELMPADADSLMHAADYQGELTDVCRYRFQPPISPARAARLTNASLSIDDLVSVCTAGSKNGFTLVEGAGGFYSPLTEDGLNADLAAALKLPIVLVAENKLGALNQVLLNVEAIKAHRLTLIAVVLNELDNDQHELMDNLNDLKERLKCGVFKMDHDSRGLDEELVNLAVQSGARHRDKKSRQRA